MTEEQQNAQYTISSGNVFADLGLAEPDVELIKADLAHAIATVIQERKLTQARAANLMGLKQPNVSLLVRGRTEDYSVGRLITLLNRLGHDVVIAHREKPRSEPVGRTLVGLLEAEAPNVAEPNLEAYRFAAKHRGVAKRAGRSAAERVHERHAMAAKQSGATATAKRSAEKIGGDLR